ncbi:MAG: DUF983 domain-containing protein [Pseudonocardiaceae bacterium]
MRRMVRAADGRTWTVQSRINWTGSGRSEQFEHDLAGGYVAGIAMLGVVIALTLALVILSPAGLVIPAWLVLLILLFLLLVAMGWALQRPWTITAYTDQPAETKGEFWEGSVRGVLSAREEAFQVIDELQERGIPDDGEGPLAPDTSSSPLRES